MIDDLTAEQVRELLDYNPLTGVFVWRPREVRDEFLRTDNTWNSRYAGKETGYAGNRGYLLVRIGCHLYLAHRLAWLYMTGEWPKEQIDHKNRNRADNRFDNLREASQSGNQQNRPCRRDSKTGLQGVTKSAYGGYRARIQVNGTRKMLGDRATPEEAHQLYLAAKAKLHTFQPVPREIAA